MLAWVPVIGGHLRRAGFGFPRLASVIGYSFRLLTLPDLFPGTGDVVMLLETVVVLLLPVWMALFGWQLLRHPAAARAQSA